MVFITTFNNISVTSWRSVLLVEETGVPGENHQPAGVHCYPCSWIVHSSLCVLCSLLSVFLDCAFFIVCLVFTVTRVPGLCILHCMSCVHCYPCSLLPVFLDCAFFIAPSVLPNNILLFSKHITFRTIGITLGFSECSYC